MEELLEILQELHPEVDFETEDKLIDDGIIDSFDVITLITELQENMGVLISAKDIIPENFNSAKALFALIERIREEEA
ncbi:MAG: acyl carrier protein [Pseudobutyrivibrio sp.]|nr:acyl carrier protein [Pseudobutyrivibrio sp.]